MAEKVETEIFLPLKLRTYKENKIRLLKIKVKTIKTLDRIKRLNELKKLKQEFRKELAKTIREIKQLQNKTFKELPDTKETKITQKKHNFISRSNNSEKCIYIDSKIDNELAKIQERIKKLSL